LSGGNTQETLRRQYRASLEMLRQAIDQCPEPLWLDPNYPNRFWHIAYHALFYSHLYLQAGEAEFKPWTKRRPDYQFLGPTSWPPHERPKIELPYSQAEVLEYHGVCCGEVEERVRSLELDSPSGFPWLPFSRMELHLYNLRHLQHHAGQLIDRLRTADNIGVAWVGTIGHAVAGPKPAPAARSTASRKIRTPNRK
jgi:hypothetical protein